MASSVHNTPPDRGLYLLVLELPEAHKLRIGRLPARTFSAGRHLYVGRARKHLAARLKRHLREEKKRFWHIDYLLPHAHIRQIWVCPDADNECEVIRRVLIRFPKASLPVHGFGSSDCRCPAHLVRLPGPSEVRSWLKDALGFQEVYNHE